MKYTELIQQLSSQNVTLVAVSKTKPVSQILELYDQGQRIFGENKVQEMVEKQQNMPTDIHWHMIGHLQTNKVKMIAPFVQLIHSLDRIKLAVEINKQGKKFERKIPCLLQIRVAQEESKYGILPEDLDRFMEEFHHKSLDHITLHGIMGMASNTDNKDQVRKEFETLNQCFNQLKEQHFNTETAFKIKSFGMSGDYPIAMETGSNMVRIGSLLFGHRNY
ncbi:YggS family pyridoxal phosphate-dependent enzyme [Membranihabitans marinus]|uniref:YggS family pyridoxal phosphate-dependent enzyme n=1 Tax=Membranihabitans marinus TaxID=1227546 RepID=UPI001F01BFF6|nr:YggS family pyridoxal phosphate-dependent enzyme [Membranihabitans marinus]